MCSAAQTSRPERHTDLCARWFGTWRQRAVAIILCKGGGSAKHKEKNRQKKRARGTRGRWRGGVSFLCLTWLWWLVVNEFLMMFLRSGSYLLGLMQLLLLLGLCAGEANEAGGRRRETGVAGLLVLLGRTPGHRSPFPTPCTGLHCVPAILTSEDHSPVWEGDTTWL